MGMMSYPKEVTQKKTAQNNKRKNGPGNKNNEKPVLIAIRETPV
jgi:hypothetical protein